MNEITYEEFIQNILDTRGRFNCGDAYYERHHIVPKSCGGGNETENLIDLYAREHFIAHRLLALENPDNDKLVYAWWCMSTVTNERTHERYQLTEEEYEEVKKALSITRSEATKKRFESEEERNKQREIQKKRFEDPIERAKSGEYTKKQYENPERRKKQSETMREKYKNPEMRKKTGDASRKMWESPEYRQKQIDIMTRIANTPEGFKARSDGAKKKWSDPLEHKKHSDRMSGGKNPRAKKIIRLSDLEVYSCISDAADKNAMSRYIITKLCNKQQDFMYYEEWVLVNSSGKDDNTNAL